MTASAPPGLLDLGHLLLGRSLPGMEDWARDGSALDLDAHDIAIVDKRLLGQGAFNDVYVCALRAVSGAAVRRIAVKEIKPQLYNGRTTTIQTGVGVDHDEPRLAHRNIATAILDGFLETGSAPRAGTVLIEGRPFVAMSLAPGISAKRYYRRDPGIVLDPAYQRLCSDLEVLAYLAGHPDVHAGNVMVAAIKEEDGGAGRDGGGYARIRTTLIDNDLSFGPRVDNPDRMRRVAGNCKTQYRHTGLPAYVDLNTASRLRSMDRRALSAALTGFLTSPERDAFEARFDRTLDHVAYLRRINRIVFDWRRFTNVREEPVDGTEFFAGTLECAGIQQGELNGEAHFTPRSTIVRDCLERRLGGAAALNALLGAERYALLVGWARSVKKHVPPSGVDHR